MPPSAITGTPRLRQASTHVEDGGELRHADAGDDAGGADRARADADLDRVGAGIDQRLGAVGGGDVAGDDLGRVGEPADLADRVEDARGMAVRGVDHEDIDAGIEQRLGPLDPFRTCAGRGGGAQAPLLVLAGVGKPLRSQIGHGRRFERACAAERGTLAQTHESLPSPEGHVLAEREF